MRYVIKVMALVVVLMALAILINGCGLRFSDHPYNEDTVGDRCEELFPTEDGYTPDSCIIADTTLAVLGRSAK